MNELKLTSYSWSNITPPSSPISSLQGEGSNSQGAMKVWIVKDLETRSLHDIYDQFNHDPSLFCFFADAGLINSEEASKSEK